MQISSIEKNGRRQYRVAWVDTDGKERRRFFSTQAKAIQFGKSVQSPTPDFAHWLALPKHMQTEVIAAATRALHGGYSLMDAIMAYESDHAAVSDTSPTVAWREFKRIKTEQQGVRPATLKSLRLQVGRFVDQCQHTSVREITDTDLLDWIGEHDWSASSRNSFLACMKTFLRWCHSRGYVLRVVTESIPKALLEDRQIGILSVKQAGDLMRSTQTHDPELIPYVALGLFAGVRPSEIQRLTWDRIDMKKELIDLRGEGTKTRRNRWVHMMPNLKAWLRLGGDLPANDLRNRFDIVREKAKLVKRERDQEHKTYRVIPIHWPSDAMRHSFASYKIALSGLAETAMESGNSEDVLLKHYRQPITKKEAEKFFSIRPVQK